jgi:2-desacetyl-2-hydroxyethyl bacteriochlorophyllide A dehydrogenase
MKMMKSIVCAQPGKLEETKVSVPIPGKNQVRIKIRAIGICGTDIHAYMGNQPFFQYPRVLGHELSGVIDAVGEGVELGLGQAVYIIPYLHCGSCVACRKGKTNCCSNIEVIGVHRDGGMCEYICVPVSAVVVTHNLSFDEMALVECLAIGAHAVRRASITAEDTVLVLGAGPIGLGAIQFAQLAGARLIVSDLSEEKLEFCRSQLLVSDTINANGDTKSILSEITQGDFPTVVIDCTGSVKAMESAFQYVGHGGTIVFVSIVKANITFNDPEFHKRETNLFGSRNATMEDFEYVVKSMQQGLVKSHAMVTHRAKFSELVEQFPTWVKPESGVIKAVIEMD